MGQTTGIEWTDATWNPVRGCSRVSEGCRNCYAERTAARFSKSDLENNNNGDQPFHGFVTRVNGHPAWTGKVELVEKHLHDPLHWKKPRRIFVNSMSDLFHEALLDTDIIAVFRVMGACPQHTFQVLTKRPERMLELLSQRRWRDLGQGYFAPLIRNEGCDGDARYLPNVWLGVSVEDQATADERIPLLLQTPAAVRFVSYEPALGPVYLLPVCTGLDWVIVGGESGPGARPFDLKWARSTIEQCKAAGVACFVKQFGAKPFYRPEYPNGNTKGETAFLDLKSKKGGDWDEWPADLRVREFPEVRDAARV
jgi:protein gp37